MTPQIRRRSISGDHGAWGEALHPVLRRAYAARGIRAAAELSTDLSRLLPVGSLGGVAAAVELLLRHRERGRILVVGDFDADGATSTALMLRALATPAMLDIPLSTVTSSVGLRAAATATISGVRP